MEPYGAALLKSTYMVIKEKRSLPFSLPAASRVQTGHHLDHKVTSVTVRPQCHMEKYSSRDLNVNTSLVSFCSVQAFNRNSSCARSPLGPGRRKDIIQIIKSVRRGRRIVRNAANITPL